MFCHGLVWHCSDGHLGECDGAEDGARGHHAAAARVNAEAPQLKLFEKHACFFLPALLEKHACDDIAIYDIEYYIIFFNMSRSILAPGAAAVKKDIGNSGATTAPRSHGRESLSSSFAQSC